MVRSLSKVNRIQRQLILHAYIYYEYDDNIWSDHQWDAKALELLELDQSGSQFEDVFKDFDGSTGYQLIKRTSKAYHEYWRSLAYHIIVQHKRITS